MSFVALAGLIASANSPEAGKYSLIIMVGAVKSVVLIAIAIGVLMGQRLAVKAVIFYAGINILHSLWGMMTGGLLSAIIIGLLLVIVYAYLAFDCLKKQ